MAKERVRLTKYDPGTFRGRFDVIVWIVFLAFFFLAGKLWFFQVIRGDELKLRSESNRIRFQEVRPLRGQVLDRDGNILVDNMPSFDVSMIPELAKNSGDVLERMTFFDGERAGRWKRQLERNEDRKPFVPVRLERDVSWQNLALIESNAFHLPGVVVDVVPVRDYRFGEMAAHILGYVGEACGDETDGGSPEAYRPGDMVGKIQQKCREWKQPLPETPGQMNRCIKESLALAYRRTLEKIEAAAGFSIPCVHIIGGGVQSTLLNRFAASAMNRPVLAGPIEAAAAGNLCAQFMAAGELGGLSDARRVVRDSFEVQEFLPENASAWDEAYGRFLKIVSN